LQCVIEVVIAYAQGAKRPTHELGMGTKKVAKRSRAGLQRRLLPWLRPWTRMGYVES
jgi:hypothetical protein